MGRIADYVATLTTAERERFTDVVDECERREAANRASLARARQAVSQLAEQQRMLGGRIRELEPSGQHLLDTVSRLYLRTVPASTETH
jgi:hypothetical protein